MNAMPADHLPQPLDPEAAAFLALVRQAGYPPLEALAPAQARKAYGASVKALDWPAQEVAAVEDLSIDGPGGALALRAYHPLGAARTEALPGVLYLHGGGWTIGDLYTHDSLCRRLAHTARVRVVAVDYRLAPEHPFPAAVHDAACALRWMAAQAARLGIDPCALGVAGDSAGGNLAAVLALMSRDAAEAGDGALPRLAHQALLYPVTDLAAATPSYARVTTGLPLTAATMHWFIGHYMPDAQARSDWRASPLQAPSLAGTAPAFVLTVTHDPLCDEGVAYVQRLSEAGVRVTHLHCNDQMHGLLGQGRLVRAAGMVADQAFAAIGHALHAAAATPLGAGDRSPQEPRPAAPTRDT